MNDNLPSDSAAPLTLQAGELRLTLQTALGQITGLWLGECPVLAAGVPLAPLAGAPAPARFDWHGRHYETSGGAAVAAPAPAPWVVEAAGPEHVLLESTQPSTAAWPFALHLAQELVLTPGALRITLTATNIDARNAPMGLGWRLALPRSGHPRLQLDSHTQAIDGDVGQLSLVQHVAGWQGAAQVRGADMALRITSSLQRLSVHAPAGQAHWTFALASHGAAALGSADPAAQGLAALQPGDSVSAWLLLEVARSA